jgi:uncharacterized RDD family membrane protein YckC
MDWHYSENGQQVGPITEERLNELSLSGVVKPETLVWHSGMGDWKPYRDVKAGPAAPSELPGRYCVSCGRQFALADLAIFGESAVCAACKPAWVQRLRQGMTSTDAVNLNYAGFWIRVLSSLIDGVIAWCAQAAALSLVGVGIFFQRNGGVAALGLGYLVSFAIGIAYQVFFWVRFGATPAKMMLGLKVVTPDGGPISVGRAFGRYLGFWVDGLTLCIGFMMAGWDSEKRALHDRIAGTRVIRTR